MKKDWEIIALWGFPGLSLIAVTARRVVGEEGVYKRSSKRLPPLFATSFWESDLRFKQLHCLTSYGRSGEVANFCQIVPLAERAVILEPRNKRVSLFPE